VLLESIFVGWRQRVQATISEDGHQVAAKHGHFRLDAAWLLLVGSAPVVDEAFSKLFDSRCRRRLLSPKRAAEQCGAKLALVVLGSALSLHGRNFSHALALAVGVLKVDVHNPVLPNRARERVAAFFAPHNIVPPSAVLLVWTALEAASVENGCLQVVEGGHRLGPLRHAGAPRNRGQTNVVVSGGIRRELLPMDAVRSIELEAGDAVVMLW
jgi:hypothetical protein